MAKRNFLTVWAVVIGMVVGVGAAGSLMAAESKANWQAEWDKTVAAAKKEGRRYFDFSDAKHSDMTPIFQLVKEFMKGREGK